MFITLENIFLSYISTSAIVVVGVSRITSKITVTSLFVTRRVIQTVATTVVDTVKAKGTVNTNYITKKQQHKNVQYFKLTYESRSVCFFFNKIETMKEHAYRMGNCITTSMWVKKSSYFTDFFSFERLKKKGTYLHHKMFLSIQRHNLYHTDQSRYYNYCCICNVLYIADYSYRTSLLYML